MFYVDKTIKKNIFALLIYQGAALLIPLITLPYIARILGVVEFGRLGWCLAIIQYFSLLIDFGFNLSITAKIATIQNDKQELTKVFFTTFYAKALLLIIGLIILAILFSIQIIRQNITLIGCCYLMVVGNFLFPMWFLQGVERMEVIANTNLLARLLSIPLIFLFVNSSQDVYAVAIIQGVTGIFASVLALFKIYQLKLLQGFYSPSLYELKQTIAEGWHYFISISSVSLYTNTNILILGLVANGTAVGYFIGVDKIKAAMLSVISPFTQAIYPKINKLMIEDEEKAFEFIAKYLLVFSFGALLYSLLIFLLSPVIVRVLLGETFLPAVRDLQILAFLPFLIILNNFFGTQIMLPLGKKKAFMQIITFSGLGNVGLLVILGSKYEDFGASISILVTEIIVTAWMGYYIFREFPVFYKILRDAKKLSFNEE